MLARKIVQLVLFLCIALISKSQIPNNVYRHTIALCNAIGDTEYAAIWINILKNYAPKADSDKISTLDGLKTYFVSNPFNIVKYMPKKGLHTQAITFPNSFGSGDVSNNLSAPVVGGALVQVVIQRAKQELTVAFFDHFKAELSKYPELDSLFPKTANFIMNIESYLYAGSLNTLRQAFADDIANLPARIPIFLAFPKIQDSIGNNPKFKNIAAIVPAFAFVGKLLDGGSVGDAIKQLYPSYNVKSINPNLYALLQIIPIFSESVRDTTGKANWIDLPTEFQNNILNNDTATNIFFGLLYEELKEITMVDNTGQSITIDDIMPTEDQTAIKNTIDSISGAIAAIQDAYKDIIAAGADIRAKKDTAGTPTITQVLDLISKAAQDAKASLLTVNKITKNQVIDQTKLNQIFAFIPQINTIFRNVYAEQFSAAAMNSFILLSQFVIEDDRFLTQKVLKYASFMAAIAEAKTSDDVATALDAAILPVGSSSIKANTAFSIALNSYIGAGYYSEHFKSSGDQSIGTKLPTFGVSLPVGVSFTLGLRNKYVGSMSIFASIIDLGAIASFKLSTPDSVQSSSLPDFTWQNLLAPGAYLVFGRLFNSPLALGFGIQKGPQLRNITYTMADGTTVDLSNDATYRIGVFLTVDIALFNLFSTPYRRPFNQTK